MTSKELLEPRFEVLAEYPNGKFKKGELLKRIKNSTNAWYDSNENVFVGNILLEEIERFPHLFRELNWWEHREKEDMPKKLICKAIKDDTEIMEILDWDMKLLFGWTNIENRKGCGLTTFNPEYGYFPVD